jgi:predicted nucleotidyltransferase
MLEDVVTNAAPERIFSNSVQMIILLEKNRESIRLKDIGLTGSLLLECYEKAC